MERIVYFKYNGRVKCDYQYEKSGNKISTKYGHNSEWTKPGKLAYKLEDNGNGWEFQDKTTGDKYRLDYAQAEMLIFLLHKMGEKLVDHVEYQKVENE